ncbi:spermatogenesis-associated protein 31D1-like [Molossus molossus]|nr:spermatogenesis-associated protein 31D1-like [Molossus molossus]
MDQLLFPLALEDATPSVSPLAPTAPGTEPSFTLSPPFSAVPAGDLTPPPLPKSLPAAPHSVLCPNPVTPLGAFSMSSLPLSLPPYPFPPLEPEFPVDHSPPQPLTFPSLPTHDTQNVKTTLTLNAIFLESSITQDLNYSPDLAQTLSPAASVTYPVPQTLSVSPPPDPNLAATQPKSMSISSKPALGKSSPDSTGALSTSVPHGTDHPSLSVPDCSWRDARVRVSLPSTSTRCDYNQDKKVGYESEKDLDSYRMGLSGENSVVSGQSVRQTQLENALTVHLSKKLEEINVVQLPGTVHSSWHVNQQTLSVQSHTPVKRRSLSRSEGGDSCLSTSQELSSLESRAQQMLEAHITTFTPRAMWTLPAKVLESIETFRDTSSHSLYNSKSSSNNLTSEVDSTSGSFTPQRGSSKTLTPPPPATSLVGKEGQGPLRPSPSDIPHGLAEEGQRTGGARHTLLPVTNSIIGKASHRRPPRANICPRKPPTQQAGAAHEPVDQSVNSGQGQKVKKSEPVPMPSVSRAEELDALQPKTSDVLTASKPGISQRINVNESQGTTTVTTESLPAKISALPDPKSANLQKQFLEELKSKLEKRMNNQVQGQPTDLSHDSDILTYKAPLSHAQGVSRVHRAAPQGPHVHWEDRGLSVEKQQEPWVPKHVSRLSQEKNFPPATKRVSPTGSKSEELGGEDAGLGTSQAGRTSLHTQDLALKERLGSKSPQALSQKGQSPPDSFFRNKINHFFPWLHSGTKRKQQEYSQEKCSLISSAQSRSPVISRAKIEKFLEEKLGRQQATDGACPQEPLPSAVQFGEAQQKAAVQAGAEPVQGHPFNSRAPACTVTNTKSHLQEAVFRDKDRHPQKVVTFKDQLLCQKHPQSVPHPSPTCRPRAAPGPPAALTRDKGIVEINIYYLDSKRCCRIFSEKIIPTHK